MPRMKYTLSDEDTTTKKSYSRPITDDDQYISTDEPTELELGGRKYMVLPINDYEKLVNAAEEAYELRVILERIDEPTMTHKEFKKWLKDERLI